MALSAAIGLCIVGIFWESNQQIYIKTGPDLIILARSFCNTIFLLLSLLLLLLLSLLLLLFFVWLLLPHQLFVQHVYHIPSQPLQQFQVTQQHYKYNSNKLLNQDSQNLKHKQQLEHQAPHKLCNSFCFFFSNT